MNTLGERLRFLRSKLQKSQKQVALDLGISHQIYSNYENNNKVPSVQVLIKLSNYYNVSTDYLLCINKSDDINTYEIIDNIETIQNELNQQLNNLKHSIKK